MNVLKYTAGIAQNLLHNLLESERHSDSTRTLLLIRSHLLHCDIRSLQGIVMRMTLFKVAGRTKIRTHERTENCRLSF